MHELGLVVDLVDMVERIAEEKKIEKVKKVTLDVGQVYMVIPRLMYGVFRQASRGTRLEGAELVLNEIAAEALCQSCSTSFNPLNEDGVCPKCGESEYQVRAGKEFEIREIEAL